MTDHQRFTKSRAGLVASILALVIGLAGLVFALVRGDFGTMAAFALIAALGAFLGFMQRASAR